MTSSEIILIAVLPFIVCVLTSIWYVVRQKEEEQDVSVIIESSTVSIRERSALAGDGKSLSVQSYLNEKKKLMETFEFPYKIDEVYTFAIVLAIGVAILSVILFHSGPLLMFYLGGVSVWCMFNWIDGWILKKKRELTVEYLEKMNDISTFLFAGKSLNDSLSEVCEGTISKVMKREINKVRHDIFSGVKQSEAFMNMYDRLQIEDIQIYAQTLRTYEKVGGNLIRIMAINDRFAKKRLEVRNEQEVVAVGQKNTQKILVGIPLAMIVGLAIISPSFFGTFYSTLEGQAIAIVAVTILIVGLKKSTDLAKGE